MTTIGSLNISFNTDVARLQSDLRKASGSVRQNSSNMRRDIGEAGQSFKLFVGSITAASAAIGAFGFSAKAALSSISTLKDLSNTAGVNVETFQEFSLVLRRFGVDSDVTAEFLKELQNRLSEFANFDTGAAKDVLESVGISRQQVQDAIGNVDELVNIAVRGFNRLETEADRTFFLEEIAGGQAGERLREAFEQGEDGIRSLRLEASRSGAIISEDLIETSDQLNDSLNVLGETAKRSFQRGVIEGFSGEFENFSDLAKDPDLQAAIKNIGVLVASVTSGILSSIRALSDFRDDFIKVNEEIGERLGNGIRILQGRPVVDNPDIGIARQAQDQGFTPVDFSNFNPRFNEQVNIDDLIRRIQTSPSLFPEDPIPPIPGIKPDVRDQGASNSRGIIDLERQADIQSRVAQVIERTRTAQESYNIELENLNELLSLGAINQDDYNRAVSLTKDEYVDLQRAGNDAYRDLFDNAENVSSNLEMAALDLGFAFESAFEKAITSGDSLRGVLSGLLEDISKIILRQTVTQPLGNFISQGIGSLGGVFSGGQSTDISPGALSLGSSGSLFQFAQGGIATGPAIFGEAGPEAAVPLPDGRRIPVDLNTDAASGRIVIQNADLRGASVEAVDRLERFVTSLDGSIEQRAIAATSDRFKRDPRFLQ